MWLAWQEALVDVIFIYISYITLQQQGENNKRQCCSLIFCKQHYVDSFFTLLIPVTIMLQHCCCIKYFDWSVTQIQGIHQNQQHFGVLTTAATTLLHIVTIGGCQVHFPKTISVASHRTHDTGREPLQSRFITFEDS